MTITEWRTLSADRVTPLFDTERERWRRELWWDCSRTLHDIDQARRSGFLPGLVASNGERIAGWSYYLMHRGAVQIGGVISESAEVTAQLVDRMLSMGERALAFGSFDAPSIEHALCRHRMRIEPYLYLSLDLPANASGMTRFGYSPARTNEVAHLLQRAYADDTSLRPFALSGSDEEWREYVAQLTLADGCGVFDRESSALVDQDGLAAAAIVSRVSSTTSHLCQLAVDPIARRRGLAQMLLAEVCARAKRNGSTRLTLTVASSNAAARELYARAGFTERARFLCASR